MVKLKIDQMKFSIEEQQWITIYGSDFLRLNRILEGLHGKLRLDEGTYFFENRDVSTFSQREMAHFRKKEVINFSEENFLMEGFTIEKNLQLQLKTSGIYPTKGKRMIARVLEDLEMRNIKELSIHQLSYFQNLQVRLAKAMVVEPKLICGHDPFRNMSEEEVEIFTGWIKKLVQRGIAVVMTTTDPQHLKYGDKEFLSD